MRIVSWNCRGKFREKYRYIQELNADIFVIQECENLDSYAEIFNELDMKYVWCGESKSKGLGVFTKANIDMKINDWPTYCLRNFISVSINGDFDLLGVWACPPYIEEYYIYQSINIDKYNSKTVIIGDFNSNAVWDKDHGKRNHSAVVKQLSKKGIVSAYHYCTSENAGNESQATFYLYKHKDKKYHIDYCFVNPNRIKLFEILSDDKWLQYSDHMPLVIEI